MDIAAIDRLMHVTGGSRSTEASNKFMCGLAGLMPTPICAKEYTAQEMAHAAIAKPISNTATLSLFINSTQDRMYATLASFAQFLPFCGKEA